MKRTTLCVPSEARPVRRFRLTVTHLPRIPPCAILSAGMLALPRHAAAQANVLPLPAPQASTVPSNGDVNPYGVAFVPPSVPTNGLLQQGGILVSNFNNNQNLQG